MMLLGKSYVRGCYLVNFRKNSMLPAPTTEPNPMLGGSTPKSCHVTSTFPVISRPASVRTMSNSVTR